MKRILYVVSGSMVLGGTETMLMNWYRCFDKNCLQVDFLCFGNEPGAYDYEIKQLGGEIFRLPSKRQNLLKNLFGTYKICKKYGYEIVHVHMDAMSFFPLLMAKIAGVKTRICHCHSTNHLHTSKFALLEKELLTRLLPYVATDLFACSEASGKWLYKKKKYKVVHNAIQVEKFLYSPEKEKQIKQLLGVTGKFVIGNVGNMNYPKNHLFMIDILFEVKKRLDNAVLIIVGDGPDRKEIENRIRDLNLENDVILTGQRNDVFDVIQAFDVFLLTSFFEGFPVVLVEAQTASVPCIVSDTVTQEVKITDLVDFVSLEADISKWAAHIIAQGHKEKKNRRIEIIKKGFDISSESKKLSRFYYKKLGL